MYLITLLIIICFEIGSYIHIFQNFYKTKVSESTETPLLQYKCEPVIDCDLVGSGVNCSVVSESF